MTSQLVFFAFDVMAVLTVLLFGLRVFLMSPDQLNARLLALICVNTACSILLSRQELAYFIPDAYRISVGVLDFPFHIARNLTPGLVMLLCFSLFQDETRFPRWLVIAFVLQVSLDAVAWWFVPDGYTTQYSWLKSIPGVLELMFSAIGLYWVFSNWRIDLVEARRRLRRVFIVIMSAIMFLVVLLERLVIPWNSIGMLYTHIASAILYVVFFNAALLTTERWGTPVYVNPFRDEKQPEPDAVVMEQDSIVKSDASVADILKAFREQHLHRDGELTIAALATKLSIPEYRLRKVIHQNLGYRNFNALLHKYRISDACQALSDPAKDHLPILTIALTVGYNSINPFNRAFRDTHGMTPTVFRSQARQKLASISEN